jgi:hypothetical protein
LEAAERAALEDIAELVDDGEPEIRNAVQKRLNELLLGEDTL